MGAFRPVGLYSLPGKVDPLDNYGHSGANGYNSTDMNTGRPAARIARALGTTHNNNAVNGSCALFANPANGGWGTMVTVTPRTVGSAQTKGAYLLTGANDIARFNNVILPAGKAFDHVYRFMLSWLFTQPGQYYGPLDATMSYSAGWGAGTVNTAIANLANRFHNFAADPGVTFTITLPAGFPGGVVCPIICALSSRIYGSGTAGWGAVAHANVDGAGNDVTVPALDYRNVAIDDVTSGGCNVPCVMRIPLGAGAHTIVITIDTMAAGTIVDTLGYIVEQPPYPPIVCPNQYRLVSYSAYGASGFPFTPTDTDMLNMNTRIAAIASEFGNRVQVVDHESLMGKQQLYIGADGAHLNDNGYKVAGAAGVNKFLSDPDSTIYSTVFA